MQKRYSPKMAIVYLFALACTAMSVSAQVCSDTEILFLFDQSENAMRASSNDEDRTNFAILKDAMTTVYNSPQVSSSSNIRLGAYGYSSSSIPQVTILEPGSSRSQALNSINLIGTGGNAGSWTYWGLNMVQAAPQFTNNRLVILSSQGSNPRRSQAQTEIDRIRGLNWNVEVIALKGVNAIDYDELTIVNGGTRPVTLTDPNPTDPTNPQGYKELAVTLLDLIAGLCGPVGGSGTSTAAPTTRGPGTATAGPTTPRPSGLCSECLFEGGYGYDFDPVYCDSFYQCLPGKEPLRLLCPAGTFWDGAQCNFINSVACPLALCNEVTADDTRYSSGRCCNQYYSCTDGELTLITCPADQVFDAETSGCITPTNITEVCAATGRYVCDVNPNGPIGPVACDGYAPDPLGDPCYYQFAGYRLLVAYGTVWDQDICSLTFTTQDFCRQSFVSGDEYFQGEDGPADPCTAVFRADFNGGSRDVYSDRLDQQLIIYSILNEASLSNDALEFKQGLDDPFLYYYFFNNRGIPSDSAFKITVKLDNPEINTVYDVFSNNYCSLCPDTISLTASATSANGRVVTATFLTTSGKTVASSAVFDVANADDMLEITVIFGKTSISGRVDALSGPDTVRESFLFTETPKDADALIAINRCGIQLGRGSNTNFVGTMDNFKFYEHCANITTI